MTELTILNPTGHLGFTPFDSESFQRGVEREPDVICADSGSADIGPNPLGADDSASPEEWQHRDLEEMLLAARSLDVPLVIGSAMDTGTDRGVDRYRRIIREISDEHDLDPFTVGSICAEMSTDQLLEYVDAVETVDGIGDRPALDRETVERTDTVVAPMGVEPYLEAFERGADVVIAGRSVDSAVFAAPAVHRGIPKSTSHAAGKLLECAGLVLEPKGARKSVLGTITEDAVVIEPVSSEQTATPASVASHALYERANPYVERFPGGYVEMDACEYEAIDARRTRVRGATYVEEPSYAVKLEGSGRVGERRVMMVGIRDPMLIDRIDETLDWSKRTVQQNVDEEYELHYHVYGQNGSMGEFEPESAIASHEVGILVEAVAPQAGIAETAAQLAGRSFMYVEFDDGTPTKGSHLASFISDEVWRAETVYEWTINHLLPIDDPLEPYELSIEHIGASHE